MVLLGAANVAVWVALECVWSRTSPNDVWAVRMSLVSGLLLLDNLCVLWWYAHTTQELADSAQRQIGMRITELRIQNKPIVFLDRELVPSRASADRNETVYVVKNVGPGIAINVHVLTEHVDGRWDVDTIGALEAGGRRVLPEHMDHRLEEHAGRLSGRVVVAEAMRTRTVHWVVTVNVPDGTGHVRHDWLQERYGEGAATLSTLQERHGQRFRDALARIRREVENTKK
jgi:hypothetical protein